MNADRRPLPLDDLRTALADVPADERAALERVWHLLGDAAPAAAAPDEAQWTALRARLGPAGPPPASVPSARTAPDRPAAARPARRRAMAVAASLAVAVAVAGWGAFGWWGAGVVAHAAPPGETLAVVLPDGSSAVLNSGSTLRHARRFGGARAVALDGEAFFDVVHGGAPFVVTTHTARVEVLGTAFDVRGYRGEAETRVALVRGRVRVSGLRATAETAEAVLAPGEAVAIAAAGVVAAPAAADVERAAGWRSGALAFDGLPLGAALAEIERRYGVAVRASPGVATGARVSAYYSARPALDALLGDIGAAAGVRFERTAQGYAAYADRRAAP